MMHQALYRKWRPKTFDDVYGQEHITSILKYQTDKTLFSHAYLFCGSRGTGKTTCAKILAKAVNCESPAGGSPCGKCPSCLAIENGTATDVIEMDAASNNGVENIRDIRDEVNFMPAMLKYRVYIVDEVHMLTGSAFNALLKTLEEPPAHIIFILATTEVNKLLPTIVSRCQRFDFRRIAAESLVSRMRLIAESEGIDLREDGAALLARLAQGGMRDAISLLELCAGADKPITKELVAAVVGVSDRGTLLRLVNAVIDGDYPVMFGTVAEVVASARDVTVFWQDLIGVYRDILLVKTAPAIVSTLELSREETQAIQALAERLPRERILYHSRLLDNALMTMNRAGSIRRAVAEITLAQMADPALDVSNEALAARIADLESRVWSGNAVAPIAPAPSDVQAGSDAAPSDVRPVKPSVAKSVSAAHTTQPTPAAQASVSLPGEKGPSQARPGEAQIRNWSELSELIGDGMLASMVARTRGFTCENGKIIIVADNDLPLTMMKKDSVFPQLLAALCKLLRHQITENDLEFRVASVLPQDDPLDTIEVAADLS